MGFYERIAFFGNIWYNVTHHGKGASDMKKVKRKWGDRKDGIWLKDIPAMNRIMPGLMPNRADNEAYINVDIDARPMNAYLAKLNEGRTEDKYTFFQLISAAIGKAFILRPKMNRFVCNY